MAEQGGSFMKQACFLFCLVLRLKSWKLLFWFLLGPGFFLNFLLFKDIEKGNTGAIATDGVTELTKEKAMAYKTLIVDRTPEQKSLLTVISNRGASTQDWIENCNSLDNCKSRFVQSVVSRSDAKYAYLNYGTQKTIAFNCLAGDVAQILCPFLYHAMSQSLEYENKPKSVFKNVTFAKYFDKYKAPSDRDSLAVSGMNISTPDSMCTRTVRSGTFFLNFQLYFMGHFILLVAGFILNFTVGTLSSISNMKENGFLQLVFNNGLSVGAFWLVYIVITIVEVLIFSALFTVSYTMQCPGFYSTDTMTKVFAMFTAFLFSLASLGFLFATIVPSFFIMLLLMILVQLVFTVTMALLRFTLIVPDKKNLGKVTNMLLFPPGHIVEYCLKYMVPSHPQLSPPKDFDAYFDQITILMVATPILLIVLTIYLDFIVKNGNGLCLPFSYPFNPNFWNPHRQKLIDMIDDQPKRANVEPTTGVPAVIANEIFMTYPAGLCAAKRPPVLRGVTCTVYQGQITGLIGHNGAGKTTLIRVLMGEEIPTSGLAVINGHRVTDPYQRLALRGSVSICKQVDVLSNYLTVMESMKLTLLAKGFSVDSQLNKVLDMMKRLGLEGKENVQAMDLSGGQMRKVCSIICLLGNPRLVILDEPTSGLDPVSRRNLWQILQDHKAGRSIILCTQFMDEADILADRKMFLSAGKLICAGSSLFLKHAFGCCATINVSLKSEGNTKQLMKMLKKVKLMSQFQTELQLQVSAEKPQVLADAIETLEDHPELVDAFGVSQAQLDDIFMRLKDIDMDNIEASFKSKKLRKLGKGGGAKILVERVDFNSLYNFESSKPMHASLLTQFSALMQMNLSRQWKAKMKFCFRIIFPVFLIVAIVIMGNRELTENNEAKKKSNNASGGLDMSKEASDSQKAIAITRLNSTKFSTMFHYNGLCIYDSDSKNGSSDDAINSHCLGMFQMNPVQAISKDAKISVKEFVQSGKARDRLRECRKSSDKVFNCLFVYANSWDPATSNADREVYVGYYERPADSPVQDNTAQALHSQLAIYNRVAQYFSSFDQSSARNLSNDNSFVVETFKGLNFYSNYELATFVTAFALIPVTYLNDPIEDKDCGVRKHLACMGMSTLAYWFNTFMLHWLHYIFCFVLTAMACLILPRYQNLFFFGNLVAPVMLLGTTSSQLSVYVISAMMKRTNAIVLVLYFFFAMFLGMIAMYVQDKYTPLFILMFLLPQFTPVAYLLMGMKVLVYTMLVFEVEDANKVPDLQAIFMSSDILLACLAAMPIQILVLMGFIFIIENPGALLTVFAKSIAPSKNRVKPIKDEGVKIEADRINKSVRNTLNMLEVRDLQKMYPNGVHAVRGTTFGTLAGEIIGLLGPNGAGKTTSMSIIVGEEASSSGSSEVHFSGTWMSGMDGAQFGAIGYCPQHNPVFNSISVFEHLRFYAQIRGIPAELAKAQIAGLIDGLGLKPHQAKAAEQLSGGNKRRLCLAIALLGNPSLVVIDEASTGVDPENKRFIWSAIRGMASKQRSVMITTHSMEEVEALCSRVGIMNKGVMIGFGTVQQLRSRHGEAYTLDVLMKAKKPRKLELKKKKLAKKIAKQFKNAIVMEDLQACMQFNLPRKFVASFSGAIRWLITKKKNLGIQYFSLYQMSLDQVFVKLVKEYDES